MRTRPARPAYTPARRHGPLFALPASMLAGVMALAAGCAHRAPPDLAAPPVVEASEPPAAAVVRADEFAGINSKAVYRSTRSETSRYLLIECVGRSAGGPLSPGDEWTLRRSTGPAASGPWHASVEQHWLLTAEGQAAIAEELNHDEQVEIVYDPPLIMIPLRLEPAVSDTASAPFEQTVRMRVHPWGNRNAVKASGSARQVITHQGGALVPTPTGPRAAQHILLTFTASLKPADVTNLTHQWLDPKLGLIAEEREERTRVFGVQTRHNRESWVLDGSPN